MALPQTQIPCPSELLLSTIEAGEIDTLKMLIEAGYDMNEVHILQAASEGPEITGTALHYAVLLGWEEGVHTLIAAQVDLDSQCNRGRTPLHWALMQEEKSIAETLINADATLPENLTQGRALRTFMAVFSPNLDQDKGKRPDYDDERNRPTLDEGSGSNNEPLYECQCCLEDVKHEEAIPCDGRNKENDVHMFCVKCINNFAGSQIGTLKFEMECFATSGCQGGFLYEDLEKAVEKKTLEKLIALDCRDAIAKANIKNLGSCSSCGFEAICEFDDFVCPDPECKTISCVKCNAPSHAPKTCQEAKLERGVPELHRIAEARDAAAIRRCPNEQCKAAIIKDGECNKITCPCGSIVCDVCKQDITEERYGHFSDLEDENDGKCRLYDDNEKRYAQELEDAQNAAIRRLEAEGGNNGDMWHLHDGPDPTRDQDRNGRDNDGYALDDFSDENDDELDRIDHRNGVPHNRFFDGLDRDYYDPRRHINHRRNRPIEVIERRPRNRRYDVDRYGRVIVDDYARGGFDERDDELAQGNENNLYPNRRNRQEAVIINRRRVNLDNYHINQGHDHPRRNDNHHRNRQEVVIINGRNVFQDGEDHVIHHYRGHQVHDNRAPRYNHHARVRHDLGQEIRNEVNDELAHIRRRLRRYGLG